MSDKIIQPTILVIVGISGDLARRKLLPALRQIDRAGLLPDKFRIVGQSRRRISKGDVLPPGTKSLAQKLETYQMDLNNPHDYRQLSDHLDDIEQNFGAKAQRLFHLSVPPQVTKSIVQQLGQAGLLGPPDSKLLLEKPFGTDLASAQELIECLQKYCREEQLYRIDHYLAKDMAQNLVVFRSGNPLIRRTWNKDFIESIDIYASERIGIEGRAAFYEQTGALRDFVESHLLQLAALVLMDLPDVTAWRETPAKRLQALEALEAPHDVQSDVVRGQYDSYRDEVHNPGSEVETYVSLRLYSHDPRWRGVPITLTTGKALGDKTTEIRMRYRQQNAAHPDELVLRIEPNESVTLEFWIKQPGPDYQMEPFPLELAYDRYFGGLPDAYERVFVDAMRSEHALFTTSAEVLAAWRILAPIQHAWSMDSSDLLFYRPGRSPATAVGNPR